MENEHQRLGSTLQSKLDVYNEIQKQFKPVFRYFFFEKFKNPEMWFERRLAYARSVATTSIAGYVVGLGDRHVNNILVDHTTAELIHIDLGIAFDQGKLLSTPELVPFRLTRDIVDGFGVTGVDGAFRSACEETLRVLRKEEYIIMTILDVFRFDPLYRWKVNPFSKRQKRQETEEKHKEGKEGSAEETTGNKEAVRALLGVQKKLSSNASVECQINELIQIAQDPSNLSRMYSGEIKIL